jgi:trans-aconitate 2-methyltransferase
MVDMAVRVLDRLPLRGDEVVMDAGCGTGRVTALLADRLPRGRVIAVDADAAMVDKARAELAPFGERVSVEHADLLALSMDDELDAVLSTATFHWVLNHDALFANLLRALRPAGRLVAQCGGAGNIASVLEAGDGAGTARWPDRFEGWKRPARYESAEATAARLDAAGFVDVRCWLEPNPVTPDDPREYLRTIVLGAHVQRLDEANRDAFLDDVLERLPSPVTIDYVRLNIDASRPATRPPGESRPSS